MEDGLSLQEIRRRNKKYLPQTSEYGKLTNCAFDCLDCGKRNNPPKEVLKEL